MELDGLTPCVSPMHLQPSRQYLQFSNGLVQSGSAQPGGPRQPSDSSMTQKPRIRRCHQPPLPFIQIRIQKSMLCSQSGIVGYDGIIYSVSQNVQLILRRLLRGSPEQTSDREVLQLYWKLRRSFSRRIAASGRSCLGCLFSIFESFRLRRCIAELG